MIHNSVSNKPMDKTEKKHDTINRDHLITYPEKEKRKGMQCIFRKKDLISGCHAS